MVGLEILGTILVTSTAKSVIKFLDEKVAEYISKKFGNKPPADVETLKKEVEELKVKLEAKEKDEINQTDVEKLRKTITEIEQKQSYLPDKIISDSIFQEWSEKKLDPEDQAPIVIRELEMLLEKSRELKISEGKRWDIRKIINAIDLNLEDINKARTDVETGFADPQELRKYKMYLKQSIFAARDVFNKTYNV